MANDFESLICLECAPETMLEALNKWGTASGKSVSLEGTK